MYFPFLQDSRVQLQPASNTVKVPRRLAKPFSLTAHELWTSSTGHPWGFIRNAAPRAPPQPPESAPAPERDLQAIRRSPRFGKCWLTGNADLCSHLTPQASGQSRLRRTGLPFTTPGPPQPHLPPRSLVATEPACLRWEGAQGACVGNPLSAQP